jgi:hypothetical protein
MFKGGATGVMGWATNNVAAVAAISGTPTVGPATMAGGYSLAIGDTGAPAGQSLLFPVKSRGKYAATDDGAAVTFTGGGTGTLKHVNGANIAYITECAGTIQAGPVKCASGNTFEVTDSGHPIYAAVAECYNDWPAGLADSVSAGPGWISDPIRCVTIRAAVGQGHRGTIKDGKKNYAGFALKGDLDAAGMPYARVCGVIVEPGCSLSMGIGASLNRVLTGAMIVREDGIAANAVATTISVTNSMNVVNQSVSSYTQYWRDPRQKPPNIANVSQPSHVRFYNCTAGTFDPGNQADVRFINCLAVPGGKGFHDAGYSDPGYASHCVSGDGTASVWDSGDGHEGNAPNQVVNLVNIASGDYHLAAGDKGAKGRGAPGLGADIDGEDRAGPSYDVGADSVSAGAFPRP